MKQFLLLKFALVFFFFSGFQKVKAQSAVAFSGQQVFSTFKFVDSQGNTDTHFANQVTGAYSLGYQHVGKKGFLVEAGVGLNKFGASKDYANLHYTWSLQYATLKAGIGYIYAKWKLQPYVLVSPYYGDLLKATQSTNYGDVDLVKNQDLKRSDYGVVATGGIRYKLSDYIGIYTAYNYIKGLQNIEVSDNQKLYNKAFSISLGVSAFIVKTSPTWLQEKTQEK
jgi:hypothetical protein